MEINIKDGYKISELGVIPDDWEVKKLGDIGKFKNGINKGKEDFGFGYPFVNLLDIFGHTKLSNTLLLGLVNSNQQERNDYDLRKGDILFVRSSVKPEGVGLTSVVIKDLYNSVYSGFLIRFRDFDLLDLGYKEYCFYEEGFRKRLIDNSTVSANTNINQEALKNLQVILPPLSEQKAIAHALSDVDNLITAIDQLITKKRNIKQGTMQQLLTGKKRLPGFSGKWEMKKLGDIGKFKNGINKGKEDFGFGYPFVNLLDIFGQTRLSNNLSLGLVNSSQKERNDYDLIKGDILFVRSSVKPEGVGLTSVVLEDLNNSVYSGFLIRFRDFDLLDLGYKQYCFYEEGFRKEIIDSSTVSANTNINQDALKNLEIKFPPTIEEQKAISEILSDIDKEIEALEKNRDKYKAIKQGMMQELLTGKTRIQIPDFFC
ncbi:restriction endonuclease subunit S [Anabaena sp. UHCC 0451]|uniref:restriction endonuclease subunit S n=1 Tax=Anabaena sp. UHCC 0451 TaxID=2055235 RepID=UPI002B1FF5C7|nr:restriction endonuclease subunit S [Anabaena sp. UHCC 0451]MEA5579435.1 restriction endonuclease subunit S [Anabaena sp. UHCC 0451]